MQILQQLLGKPIHNITTTDLQKIQRKFDGLKKDNDQLKNNLKCIQENAFVKIITEGESYSNTRSAKYYSNNQYIALKSQTDILNRIQAAYERDVRMLQKSLDRKQDYASLIHDIRKTLLDSVFMDLSKAKANSGYFSNNKEQLEEVKEEIENIVQKIDKL